MFLLTNLKILFTLFHSKFSLIAFDPGLVDSPPISTKVAPEFNNSNACLAPFFFELYFPPSEKLSGVRFKTPSILGIFLKLR